MREGELQNRLKIYCPNLVSGSDDEKFIQTWFYPRIKKIEEHLFKDYLNMVVAEICLLNGLETYDDNEQSAMYVAQMRIIAKFISEGFSFLSLPEITNAFHLNLRGKLISENNKEIIKQFGKKQINCEFIGQVLTAYCAYKEKYINNTEGMVDVINPPAQIEQKIYEFTEEDYKNEFRRDINASFHEFLTNPKWNYQLLNYRFYDQLEEDGAFKKDLYLKLEKKAKMQLIREKQLEHFHPTSLNKVKQQMEDGSIGSIIEKNFDLANTIDSQLHQLRNGVNDTPVEILAKQMTVKFYFYELLADKKRTVYAPEKK